RSYGRFAPSARPSLPPVSEHPAAPRSLSVQHKSRCGARNHPGKSETYRCVSCGLVADRDLNAALNILAAGVIAAGAQTWAVGPCVAPEPYAEAA
ncbi:MAG: zinc ribbon domain-containing protein, partial [Bryobacterales bacterium]|nr:zinc ribbon domain-containing protein [Bryobacterales bacterium]